MELEDEADLPVAEHRQPLGAHRRELLAVELDRAARRQIERAEDLQEGRLADARGADHRDHVARRQVQLDVRQHRQHAAAVDVLLAHADDVDPGADAAAGAHRRRQTLGGGLEEERRRRGGGQGVVDHAIL
jgi:hypothetical protein